MELNQKDTPFYKAPSYNESVYLDKLTMVGSLVFCLVLSMCIFNGFQTYGDINGLQETVELIRVPLQQAQEIEKQYQYHKQKIAEYQRLVAEYAQTQTMWSQVGLILAAIVTHSPEITIQHVKIADSIIELELISKDHSYDDYYNALAKTDNLSNLIIIYVRFFENEYHIRMRGKYQSIIKD